MPTGYTLFRRIGAILADGSKNITQFIQYGDEFIWSNGLPTDFSLNLTLAGGAQLGTLTVPTGVKVWANFNCHTSASSAVYATSPDAKDEAVSVAGPIAASMGTTAVVTNTFKIRTNTSAQIRFRANTTVTVTGSATSWNDPRGRDA
jgi:hypothetical protein